MKYIFLILIALLPQLIGYGQNDSAVQPRAEQQAQPPHRLNPAPAVPSQVQRGFDSSKLTGDSSIQKDAIVPAGNIAITHPIDTFYKKLLDNPYLQMKQPPVYLVVKERVRESKDELFYLFAALFSLLAFIKLIFPRYFGNIFRLFFQPSFRQKQTREQLLQSNLPSLLMNLFFILSGGTYMALLVQHYGIAGTSFWILFLYCAAVLLVLYAGKYLFLSFAGWVFNVKEASETYMFVVYLINKIVGVVLLPFVLLIAFSEAKVIAVAITVSVLLIGLLFIYRYVVSYGPVRREVKVSPLHFLFYVFAFEITPLLLIYKSLMIYLNKSL